MTRTASLGMYDAPAVRAANDALWATIAAGLADHGMAGVPPRLDRARPLDAIWTDLGLLLAQCCGYPLATRYRARLRYVATPCYAVPGCAGADYRSRLVVRRDDPAEDLAGLRGRRAAVNEPLSNSGMNLFRAAIAPLAAGRPFFAAVIPTGSHAASLRAVADGAADIAAIDTVSFAHIAQGDPALAGGVRTIGWTEAAPGLPFVTAHDTDDATVAVLRRVLADASRGVAARDACRTLLLTGIECLPPGSYDAVLEPERAAARLGYPALA